MADDLPQLLDAVCELAAVAVWAVARLRELVAELGAIPLLVVRGFADLAAHRELVRPCARGPLAPGPLRGNRRVRAPPTGCARRRVAKIGGFDGHCACCRHCIALGARRSAAASVPPHGCHRRPRCAYRSSPLART
eukprot:Amastigsp_a841714_446.p5 type:complete len:136 gc:universal Amastigsp_a841714_446:559-152(-)